MWLPQGAGHSGSVRGWKVRCAASWEQEQEVGLGKGREGAEAGAHGILQGEDVT